MNRTDPEYKGWLKTLKRGDKAVFVFVSNNHNKKYNLCEVYCVADGYIEAAMDFFRPNFDQDTGEDCIMEAFILPLDAETQAHLDKQSLRIKVTQALAKMKTWDLADEQISAIAKILEG